MRARFLIISTIAVSVFAVLWNGLVHLVVLKAANSSIESIHRPDMAEKMWLSIVLTISIVLLYTISFLKWRKTGSFIETIKHGLFFAVLMIMVVDINQYVQYEIPFSLIMKWSFFGALEFSIYGIIINYIFKKTITNHN